MSRSATLIGLAVALALSACSGESKSPGPRADADGGLRFGSLVFKPCSLSVASAAAVEAQCTTLAVPEDHAAPLDRAVRQRLLNCSDEERAATQVGPAGVKFA